MCSQIVDSTQELDRPEVGLSNFDVAISLAKLGIRSFPCGNDKRPKVPWKEAATCDENEIKRLWAKHPDALVGVVTGVSNGIFVVDLDAKGDHKGQSEYKRLGFDFNEALFVVRTPRGHHLYFDYVPGIRNSQDYLGKCIDIRGEGGYVIAAGSNGPHGTYRFVRGSYEDLWLVGSPAPPLLIEALSRRSQEKERSGDVSAEQPIDDPDFDKIREAVSFIPSDGSRESWLTILMALHHATNGSIQGLELAQKWSQSYHSYDPNEVEVQWSSFQLGRANKITVATLFHRAKQHGWSGIRNTNGVSNTASCEVTKIDELNERYALVRHGSGSAIAVTCENGDVEFMSCQAFRELYSNQVFEEKQLGSAWMTSPKRRTYINGVRFDPAGKDRPGYLNLFTGFEAAPEPEADFGLIYDHIFEVVSGGNQTYADYIISWLADVVKNPAEKPGVALVLKGKKGVGKDTLAEIMKGVLGRRYYAHATSTERLTGRFNAAFATALLIHVEEAIWGGKHDLKGALQSLITCPTLPLERKHVDTVEVDNFSRLMFTTNEAWAVPATFDERRYAVFEVSDVRQGDREYFGALYSQIKNGGCSGFLAFLLSWETPPHVDLRDPPTTKGLMEQKLSGLRNLERWWFETLTSGQLTNYSYSVTDPHGPDWSETSQTIPKADLRKEYTEWLKGMRYQGEPKGPAEFGESFLRICPLAGTRRSNDNGVRVWQYTLPNLEECRKHFTRAMGGSVGDIEWEG